MTFLLAWAALRRHPFSISITALLATLSAGLLGAPMPLGLPAWLLAALVSLKIWRTIEPFSLRKAGCRAPNRLERERLDLIPQCAGVQILVVDAAAPWLLCGVRCLVISRGLLDLLEDRALVGLLGQAATQVPSVDLAAEMLVWLGNLPLLSAWLLGMLLGKLGRPLAATVGLALVLPHALWREGFTRWAGLLFGSVIVGLTGSAMISSGLAAPGLGLLFGWAIVPGLVWLLSCEGRRAEMAADDASTEAGLGWQLIDALETLMWAEALPAPGGLLGLLRRDGAPLNERADRIWRRLSKT